MKKIFTFLAALACVSMPAFAANYDLHVNLEGVRNAEGRVRLGLYADPKTFRKERKAVTVQEVVAEEGTVEITIADVPPGTYAIMAYHDEDGDGGLDRLFGMIPTEGYGLSNNPEVSGPPAFEDSAFEVLPDADTTLNIQIKYR